jgi:CRISPR-associated protein Cas1
MLHGEAVRSLCAAGLDPLIGFYHELSYKRESLACDLVEVFRARADYWVVRLFNLQILRMDHFSFAHEGTVNGACLMGKAGRAHYFPAWDTEARRWRRGMRRIANAWARAVLVVPSSEAEEDDGPDLAGD